MGFYARPSALLVRQVTSDVALLAWAIGWGIVGWVVNAVIRAVAEPARQTAALAGGVRDQIAVVATQADGIPLVGDGLHGSLTGLAGTVGDLATTAQDQVRAIENTALWAGWLTFAVPFLVLAWIWLNRHLAYAEEAKEVRQLAATSDGNDLLALRALATQPPARLHAVASDPVAAWRARDPLVTARLADLELARAGVSRARTSGTG